MRIAYFDESGHSADDGFFAISAFVASDDDWRTFRDRWNAGISASGAPYLHMREFAHGQGPYQGWSEVQRKTLLASCVESILAIRAVAVGAVMDVATFNALTDEEKIRMQDPFFCCLQEAVRGAAINGIDDDPGARVKLVYSNQDEFHGKAMLLHASLKESLDVRDRVGDFSFADMRNEPALQAADLLAYELRHHYQNGRSNPPRPTRWAFRQIVEHQRNIIGARMLKYLPEWYVKAQAAGEYDRVFRDILSRPDGPAFLISETSPELR